MKILRYSNWGNWDRLNGVTLIDGELLVVDWPDGGPSTIVRARVIDHGMAISDHGNSYQGQDVRAYAQEAYRGVVVDVPLVGLEARRHEP